MRIALSAALLGVSAAAAPTAYAHQQETQTSQAAAQIPQLASRHTSVYNRIDYLIPEGWVVIDGETDWIAPTKEKMVGHEDHDPAADPVYSAGVILPYLSVADVREKRRASLEGLTRATLHSLEVAAGARRVGEPEEMMLGGKRAFVIHAAMPDEIVLYQIFLDLPDGRVGMTAGVGPNDQEDDISALVTAIAASIEAKVPHSDRTNKKEDGS